MHMNFEEYINLRNKMTGQSGVKLAQNLKSFIKNTLKIKRTKRNPNYIQQLRPQLIIFLKDSIRRIFNSSNIGKLVTSNQDYILGINTPINEFNLANTTLVNEFNGITISLYISLSLHPTLYESI